MGYPDFVRHARGTVAIALALAITPAFIVGCAKAKKAAKGGGAPVSSVDPVTVAEMASAAPSSSAGYEAFHRAFTLHDAACAGGDFSQCVALGIDYEMAGKDLIDSVKLSGEICRALGATPPEGFNYELFLDEEGDVRKAAVRAVGRLSVAAATPAFLNRLADLYPPYGGKIARLQKLMRFMA